MSGSHANDLRTALTDALTAVQPRKHLLSPVRVLAFWAAIALPFLYVPLLLSGLQNTASVAAFLALLVANGVALLVGHAHRGD